MVVASHGFVKAQKSRVSIQRPTWRAADQGKRAKTSKRSVRRLTPTVRPLRAKRSWRKENEMKLPKLVYVFVNKEGKDEWLNVEETAEACAEKGERILVGVYELKEKLSVSLEVKEEKAG